MIKTYKQYNESLRDLMVGPTEEEVILYKLKGEKLGWWDLQNYLRLSIKKGYKDLFMYCYNHRKDMYDTFLLYTHIFETFDLEFIKDTIKKDKIIFINKDNSVKKSDKIIYTSQEMRSLFYTLLRNRKLDFIIYFLQNYNIFNLWELEWLYDMIKDKREMGYKNIKEGNEIYKPVIIILEEMMKKEKYND